MKKLCGDGSILRQAAFEMRFCCLDLYKMVFKYAKSPKDGFTTHWHDDMVSWGTTDENRKKPIKLKNHEQNKHELKYLIHIRTKTRKYVLSADTKSNHSMWIAAFQVFFNVKSKYDDKIQNDVDEKIIQVKKDREATIEASMERRRKNSSVDKRAESTDKTPPQLDNVNPPEDAKADASEEAKTLVTPMSARGRAVFPAMDPTKRNSLASIQKVDDVAENNSKLDKRKGGSVADVDD